MSSYNLIYSIAGMLSSNKFNITVKTYRIAKETKNQIKFFNGIGQIKTINKSKLYNIDSITENKNGFYTLSVYVTDKKDVKVHIDRISNQLKQVCNNEYFKVLDAYRLCSKKPKVQKQDISGKYLDNLLNSNDYV